MTRYAKGDAIEVTCEGRTVEGEVLMISENQVSAIIGFDAMIGTHAGMMPVTRWDTARNVYRSIIDGTEVTIRKKARQ
jgi:metal-dependent amidase/aminoacylase/carboxypeptidase family protein